MLHSGAFPGIPETRVDDTVVKTVEQDFERIGRNHYRRRYAELRRHTLQRRAYAVALPFDATDSTSRKEIFDAVREGPEAATGSAKSAEVLKPNAVFGTLELSGGYIPSVRLPGLPVWRVM